MKAIITRTACAVARWLPVAGPVFLLQAPDALSYPYSVDKKLIQYGWDMPSAKWMADNIGRMEEMPFDGVCFFAHRENRLTYLFDPSPWPEADIDWESCDAIAAKQATFRHNFAGVFSSDRFDFEWFNDTHWEAILANMKLAARAAKRAECVGLLFDTEAYSDSKPWRYSDHSEGHGRAEVEAKMRLRGGQVMAAWQSEFPDIKILCTVLLYHVPWGENFEMLPAFVNGMLDSIGPRARIIEGHEDAFYWKSTGKWYEKYRDVRVTFRDTYIAPENRGRYDRQVQAGTTCYPHDFCSGALTPSQRLIHEHHIYTGLAASDEYCWYFNEQFAFWDNPEGRTMGMPTSAPPWDGIVETIESAREKWDGGNALGYDMLDREADSSIALSIDAPSFNATFNKGETVTVVVSSSGAPIDKVSLYVNAMHRLDDSTAPYEFTLDDLDTGSCTLVARGYGDGTTGTSNPATMVVTDEVSMTRSARGFRVGSVGGPSALSGRWYDIRGRRILTPASAAAGIRIRAPGHVHGPDGCRHRAHAREPEDHHR